MSNEQALAILISRKRVGLQMSQRTFADFCGISRRTLQNIESGKTKTSLETLEYIADFLRTSVDKLLEEAKRINN